jgi:hypothetical protein
LRPENGARRCCVAIGRRIESPIVDFSDDGTSTVSSAIRILPGDGVLKLVNFIQVDAACFGARPQGERAERRGFGAGPQGERAGGRRGSARARKVSAPGMLA